jgi:hypothetical protein
MDDLQFDRLEKLLVAILAELKRSNLALDIKNEVDRIKYELRPLERVRNSGKHSGFPRVKCV